MRTSHKSMGWLMLVLVAVLCWDVQAQQSRERGRGRAGRVAPHTELKAALDAAITDERLAIARYQAIIAKFGERRPVTNILQAEHRHEAALQHHYQRLGIPMPAALDPTIPIAIPATFAEACAESARLERENGALFDELLKTVTDEAVRETFINLRDASVQRHLPALERQAQAGGRRGPGPSTQPSRHLGGPRNRR